MEDFTDMFPSVRRDGSNSKFARTGFYYAYEMLAAGIKKRCKEVGQEAQWLPEYEKVVEWLKDNHNKGLMLYGDIGLGKSMICRDIIPYILDSKYFEANNTSCCIVYDSFVLNYKATEELELDRYGIKFVVIDDVGRENELNHFGTKRTIFNEVVDYAESHGIVLIITTNLNLEKLKDKYGARTVDRLRALVTPVLLTGKSMRNGSGEKKGFPEEYRAYGINFDTEEEAEAFSDEQRLLRDYVSYSHNIEVYKDDYGEWEENQPFRVWKGFAYAITKHEWEHVEWENDPDRLEYLKRNFYE